MNVQKLVLIEKSLFSSIKLFLILIPASLALHSCTSRDLKAARSLGEVAENLEQLNDSVSLDIYDSCVRSVTWLNRDTSVTGQNIRQGLQDCDTLYRPNSDRTRLAGDLLVGYVMAIGQLAEDSGQKESVRTQFESIGESLSNLQVPAGEDLTVQFFPASTIDTGVNIATFLTNLLLSDFRRSRIKLAVVCTDDDIQSYSADFVSFIDELYSQEQLNDEIDSITRFYLQTNLLSDVIQPLQADNVAEIQNTQDRRNAELRTELLKINDRKNTASAYINAIRETAATHAKLKQIFNKGKDELSAEQTAKCDRYFAADTAKTSLKTSVNEPIDSEISPVELAQVGTIVDEYIARMQLLLNATSLERDNQQAGE
jgi:hypothetical protein